MANKRLGKTQKLVLESLKEHGAWGYSGCGWLWDTWGNTKRIMDSLVAKGYATLEAGIYRPCKVEKEM